MIVEWAGSRELECLDYNIPGWFENLGFKYRSFPTVWPGVRADERLHVTVGGGLCHDRIQSNQVVA